MGPTGILNAVKAGDRATDAAHPVIEKDADHRRSAVQDIVHDIVRSDCHAAMIGKTDRASLSQRKLGIWCRRSTGICGSTKKNLVPHRIWGLSMRGYP
jgi:hypothetical protein